jgi:anti-sigma factor RsiW
MYDCKTTIPLIGFYADNELESLATSKVAAHLERCALCRRELEITQTHKRLLADGVKSAEQNATALRASIEATTIRAASFPFGGLQMSRAKAGTISAAVILLTFVSLYFYQFVGNVRANSLYQAAARDHTVCSKPAEAEDWAQSASAIAEKAKNLLQMEMSLPRTAGTDYVLVRARLCQLNGKSFLHLVYETPDGRIASLFICPNTMVMPSGQRTLTVDSSTVQVTRVSDLTVNGTSKRSCVLLTVASDETVATALLLNAATA